MSGTSTIAALLAACSAQRASEQPQSNAPAAAVDYLIGSFSGEALKIITDQLIPSFQQKHPGLTVNLLAAASGEDYPAKILSMVVAGTPPDMLFWAGPHQDLARGGHLYNLDKLVRKDKGFDIKQFYDGVTSFYRDPPGGLWGLPYNYATEGLYYSKKLFADAGLTPPTDAWTWDDFTEAARKLTRDTTGSGTPDVWGAAFRLQRIDHVLWSFGGGFTNDDNTKSTIAQPMSIAGLQFLADLILKHRVHPPRSGPSGFQQGQLAMAFAPEWYVLQCNAVQGLDYDVAIMPKGPKGRFDFFYPGGVGLFAKTKVADQAWEVAKWFCGVDGGAWQVPRALIFNFPESPSALIKANEYFWNQFLQKPANRGVFPSNPSFAKVPFFLKTDGAYLQSQLWPVLEKQVWTGQISPTEGAQQVDRIWATRLAAVRK